MAEATVSDTWQCDKSVLERNKYMLDEQLATDVTFLVGEKPERQILAHRYVLISGSPVFYSMFCGEMKERGEVKVPDITPDTFTEMLRYLYYEEADIDGESVMQIMYGAKKYLIPGLTKKCTNFLENHLNGENVSTILEQCLLFDEKEMVSKCMEVVGEQTQEVLKSKSFGQISNDALVKILESNCSSVGEVELFQGTVDWARRKISKKSPSGDVIRDTLAKALYKIRFPVMTIEEFADIVAPTEILKTDDEVACYRYIVQKNKPTSMLFPTTSRVDNSCKYIHLIKDKNQGSVIIKQITYLDFTIQNNTSNDLSLKGFVPYESIITLYLIPPTKTFWEEVGFQTQCSQACAHTKGQTCITFPVVTIPAGSIFTIRMHSKSGHMSYTPTVSGLMFMDPRHTIGLLVTGGIPISEILIAKSTT